QRVATLPTRTGHGRIHRACRRRSMRQAHQHLLLLEEGGLQRLDLRLLQLEGFLLPIHHQFQLFKFAARALSLRRETSGRSAQETGCATNKNLPEKTRPETFHDSSPCCFPASRFENRTS